ncbi:hypothetical protein CRG98_042993 [Punica granatum]|uniref:Uncharacterized protein n=1 Tax=Punica granatum TaxID=22663 RepID=A0A2I0HYK4_PUNGR|nr:hypothetical protein CRG98_042993 [Punica granatum]
MVLRVVDLGRYFPTPGIITPKPGAFKLSGKLHIFAWAPRCLTDLQLSVVKFHLTVTKADIPIWVDPSASCSSGFRYCSLSLRVHLGSANRAGIAQSQQSYNAVKDTYDGRASSALPSLTLNSSLHTGHCKQLMSNRRQGRGTRSRDLNKGRRVPHLRFSPTCVRVLYHQQHVKQNHQPNHVASPDQMVHNFSGYSGRKDVSLAEIISSRSRGRGHHLT